MSNAVSSREPHTSELSNGTQTPARSSVRIAGLLALLLLAIIVVPPFVHVDRFRRSLLRSIGQGLGRRVEASSVELQMFPLPSFVLRNFTVSEDPAFGAEPVLTAETVTVLPRASTLWHRRVEIATLSFKGASVNLVRNAAGQWNFEHLLRNSPALQARAADGKSSAPGPMPFPYVEATGARVNFKLGAEKLPFSLEQANLALWKESSHEWRMRLRARPVRTDLVVSDAGEIRGQGALDTRGPLLDSPVSGTLEWRKVQLGEIDRLIHGQDSGWSGTANATGSATGTLSNLSIRTDLAVEEFRRAEFIPSAEMDLSARCQARYVRGQPNLSRAECSLPADGGRILAQTRILTRTSEESAATPEGLRVNTSEPHGDHSPSLALTLQRVPAAFLLQLFGHVHPGVDPTVQASGEFSGTVDCVWPGTAVPRNCTGEIRSTKLGLDMNDLDRPIEISPLTIVSNGPQGLPAQWTLAPAHLSLGGAEPATVRGTLTRDGGQFQVQGPAELSDLRLVAQELRLPAFSGEIQSLSGTAQLDLSAATQWVPPLAVQGSAAFSAQPASAFSLSHWTGTLQISNAAIRLRSLPRPVRLASAQVNLTPGEVTWTRMNGAFGHIPFDGTIRWQTPCAAFNVPCSRSFALHTARLDAARLEGALRGGTGSANLLQFIDPWSKTSPRMGEIHGTAAIDALSIGRMTIRNAALELHLAGHTAQLLAISGKVFGGRVTGAQAPVPTGSTSSTGAMHWGDGAPDYSLQLELRHIKLQDVAALWREQWGRGTADAGLDVKTHGWNAGDLTKNANGTFRLNWSDGGFAIEDAAAPEAAALTSFHQWRATGQIRDKALVFQGGSIVPAQSQNSGKDRSIQPRSLPITGTMSFSRMLNLNVGSEISISGPLASPALGSPRSR